MWLNGHIFCGFKLNYTNYKLVNLYMCVDQLKKKMIIIMIKMMIIIIIISACLRSGMSHWINRLIVLEGIDKRI